MPSQPPLVDQTPNFSPGTVSGVIQQEIDRIDEAIAAYTPSIDSPRLINNTGIRQVDPDLLEDTLLDPLIAARIDRITHLINQERCYRSQRTKQYQQRCDQLSGVYCMMILTERREIEQLRELDALVELRAEQVKFLKASVAKCTELTRLRKQLRSVGQRSLTEQIDSYLNAVRMPGRAKVTSPPTFISPNPELQNFSFFGPTQNSREVDEFLDRQQTGSINIPTLNWDLLNSPSNMVSSLGENNEPPNLEQAPRDYSLRSRGPAHRETEWVQTKILERKKRGGRKH